MGIISDLKPLNLGEEKTKFLNDPTLNPQFEYVRSFSKEELTQYGQPGEKYFLHSRQMLNQHPPKSSDITLTEVDVDIEIQHLFHQLKIPALTVNFSEDYSSQILISDQGLFFRLPLTFSKDMLRRKLNHEIQSHYLRSYNQRQQSFSLEGQNEVELRLTEEGIANLHTYVFAKNKVMTKTYFNYYATYLAQKQSFSELYQALLDLGLSSRLSFNVALRKKRGLTDTSQPGGFTKDLVYLEGTVKVWQWLMDSNNSPHDLYLGKISLAEIETIKPLAAVENLVYPTFFDNLEEYYQQLKQIGEINHFSALI